MSGWYVPCVGVFTYSDHILHGAVCPHREFQYIVQRIPNEHARRHQFSQDAFALSIYRYYALPKYVVVRLCCAVRCGAVFSVRCCCALICVACLHSGQRWFFGGLSAENRTSRNVFEWLEETEDFKLLHLDPEFKSSFDTHPSLIPASLLH